MFVELLDKNEKNALVQLIVSIAKADGNVSQEEVDFLTAYANENDVVVDLNKEIDLTAACSAINSYEGSVVAIQEIVKMALSDGHYDESERRGAAAIAEMLNLTSDKFLEIENWVVDGQKWLVRGEELLTQS